MKITADGEKLLVGDYLGHLKLISSRDGTVIKDFGRAHNISIIGITITPDQKFCFTSCSYGTLKKWNHQDNTLVKDYGNIVDSIWSLHL